MRYLPIHAINFVYSSAREIQCWGRYGCLLTKAKRGITLRLRGLQCSFLFSGFLFMKWGLISPLWMKMSFHSPSTVLKFRICFPKNASKIDAPLESQIEILTLVFLPFEWEMQVTTYHSTNLWVWIFFIKMLGSNLKHWDAC